MGQTNLIPQPLDIFKVLNNLSKWKHTQVKQMRTKNWTLWNTVSFRSGGKVQEPAKHSSVRQNPEKPTHSGYRDPSLTHHPAPDFMSDLSRSPLRSCRLNRSPCRSVRPCSSSRPWRAALRTSTLSASSRLSRSRTRRCSSVTKAPPPSSTRSRLAKA